MDEQGSGKDGLSLTFSIGETFYIGDHIKVQVKKGAGKGRVKLQIKAPRSLTILREVLIDKLVDGFPGDKK